MTCLVALPSLNSSEKRRFGVWGLHMSSTHWRRLTGLSYSIIHLFINRRWCENVRIDRWKARWGVCYSLSFPLTPAFPNNSIGHGLWSWRGHLSRRRIPGYCVRRMSLDLRSHLRRWRCTVVELGRMCSRLHRRPGCFAIHRFLNPLGLLEPSVLLIDHLPLTFLEVGLVVACFTIVVLVVRDLRHVALDSSGFRIC